MINHVEGLHNADVTQVKISLIVAFNVSILMYSNGKTAMLPSIRRDWFKEKMSRDN